MKLLFLFLVIIINHGMFGALRSYKKKRLLHSITFLGKEANLGELLDKCRENSTHPFSATLLFRYDAQRGTLVPAGNIVNISSFDKTEIENDNFIYTDFCFYKKTCANQWVPVGALIIGRNDSEAIEEIVASYMSAQHNWDDNEAVDIVKDILDWLFGRND